MAIQYGLHGWLGITCEAKDAGLGLRFADKGVASLLVAVMSILALTSLSIWLARSPARWVLALGGPSMGSYVMHVLASSGARILVGRVLGVHAAWVHLLAGCLAGILLPMLVLWLLGRLKVRGLFEAPAAVSAEAWYRRRFGMPRA